MRRILEFLRLVDPHDGNLSISSIAMIVVLGVVAYKMYSSTMAPLDAAALLTVVLNYLGKKSINSNLKNPENECQ